MSKARTTMGVLGTEGRWWPLALAIVSLTPFAPLLLPDGRGVAVPPAFDYANYQLPTRQFARDEILAGRFPLWLPYLACGTPLHATQQASLCYPLLTPLVLVFGAGYGINVSIFLHLLLCFAGEYLLGRKLDLSPPAAGLAALATTWSMFAMDHLAVGHVTVVLGYSLAPWFFFALVALLSCPGIVSAVTFAFVVACMALVGHPQLPYYALCAGACWAAASLTVGAASARRARCIASLVGALILAAALSAVQWLPVAELARAGFDASPRGTPELAALWAMDGGDLLGLLMPDAKGGTLAGLPELEAGEYLHERGAYLGLATLILAVYALTRAARARWGWGMAWLCLVAGIFAVGESTPLFHWFGAVMPGAFWFRCPGRVFGIIAPLAALLAGRGLDALMRREGRADAARTSVFAAWLALASAFFILVVWQWLDRIGWQEYCSFTSASLQGVLAWAAATAGITAVALSAAHFCRCRHVTIGYVAVLLVLAADLHAHTVSRVHFGLRGKRSVPAELLSLQPPVRIAGAPDWPRVRAVSLRYSGLAPMALDARRSAIDTCDGGILPSGIDRLHRAIEADPEVALALAACDYLFVPHKEAWLPLLGSLPRVRFLSSTAKNLWEAPIEGIGVDQLAEIRRALVGKVAVVHEDSRALSIHAEAPCAGALIIADTSYPGWSAQVDGRPVQIETAHGVFRLVRLSSGTHHVELAFAPRSFAVGSVVSVCGLALTAAIGFRGWRISAVRILGRDSPTTPSGQ